MRTNMGVAALEQVIKVRSKPNEIIHGNDRITESEVIASIGTTEVIHDLKEQWYGVNVVVYLLLVLSILVLLNNINILYGSSYPYILINT